MTTYHAAVALVGTTVRSEVRITVDGSIIAAVDDGGPLPGDVRLGGIVLPGLANAHSHAFHRALRGRTGGGGDFWSWREAMYRVAAMLDPDSYGDLAAAVFAEMVLAGITTVGEFHYIHHPAGGRYRDPNAMGEALIAAAATAGVRLTLIDSCYLRAGFGREAEGVQRRFDDGSADAWMERVAQLGESGRCRIGAAVHSVRAVDAVSAAAIAAFAREREMPLHFHLSEQPAENDECLEATGSTPTALLAAAAVLGPTATAIHATHVGSEDVALLGGTGTVVCMCPTTERDLGDGIGPVPELIEAGCRVAVGSDSNAVVDLFEEARLVDLHERLRSGTRGTVPGHDLLDAATIHGWASLGWEGGRIEAGAPADLVAVDLESVRTAGAGDPLAAVIHAATAGDVTDVVVAGERVVTDGLHHRIERVGTALDQAVRRVLDD